MKKYAVFFPQFHQTRVNDLAWGYGFTDWSLVASANAFDIWRRRAPASGFYDLANPAHITERFAEAAGAGLDGFGIYHYRFDDGPELDTVERYLKYADLPNNFNFFFIWANESWSKRWAGKDTEILKSVSSSPAREQIRDHVDYLAPYFSSGSYTKIQNRPMFVIYRPEVFQDPSLTLSCYREEFHRVGLDPMIGFFLKSVSDIEYSKIFDFCYLFEPRLFFNFYGARRSKIISWLFKRILLLLPYEKVELLSKISSKIINRGYKSYSFTKFLTYFTSGDRYNFVDSLSCPVQNILTSGWNNAPRYREYFTEVKIPTTEQFSRMLSYSLADPCCSENIPLLCNAWNEWSEGAAIEPCVYLGDTLLKAYLHPHSPQ